MDDGIGPIELEFIINNPELATAAALAETTMQGVTDVVTGQVKQASAAIDIMTGSSIGWLKVQVAQLETLKTLTPDISKIAAYNQKIEELQATIQTMGNAGKTGFDGLGNAVQKITPAIQEVAVEAEVAVEKVGRFEAAINRVTSVSFIGARVVTQLSRQIIGLGVGMLSFAIGSKAIEALAEWISKLSIFNPVASEAKLRQEELNKAFESTDYSNAIKSIDELTINIGLAKDGFLDKTKVLKEYNDKLGASIGYADNLDIAEQNIVKHGNAFIHVTLLKAAAQLALSDAAKKTYEAAQIAANPPTQFGGKNNQGSFADNSAPQAIKDYYAGLNKSQADHENEKVQAAKDQAAKLLSIADKFQKDAAAIAKKEGMDFFDGTEDEKVTKTKPKKTDHSEEVGQALLAAQTSIQDKIAALKDKYQSKDKTRDEQQLDAIKANFAAINAAIDAENTKLQNAIKDKKITKSAADKLGLKPQPNISPDDLNDALEGEKGAQSVEPLKLQAEQMKAIFAEYEAYKLKAGTDTANQLYGNELKGFTSYIDYLKSLQPTEAQLNSGDEYIKAQASATKDFLDNKATPEAKTAALVANQKQLDNLILQIQDYGQRRETLVENAETEITNLTKAGYADRTGVVMAQLQAQLALEDDAQAQKVLAAKNLTISILNETKERATIQLKAASDQNDLELATGKISVDTFKAVAAQINTAQAAIKLDVFVGELAKVGAGLSTLGSQISATNTNFGALVSALGSVLTNTSKLFDLAADVSKNYIAIVTTGLQGIIGLVSNLTSAAAARKTADIDYYNSVIAYQTQYNELLITQQQLQYQTDANIFISNNIAELNDGANALREANTAEQASIAALSAGQAIVGQKNVISGANVAKGAESGAEIGGATGALLAGPIGAVVGAVGGAVIGAITGLFATKSANVLTPLLQQYPSLVQTINGVQTLNTAQAQALLQNNQVTASTKVLIQTALDYQKEQVAALAQVQAALTSMVGSLGSSLDNALVTAFENGTSAAEAFGNTVSGVIGNMVQQFLFNDIFGHSFDTLNAKLKADAGGTDAQITADVVAGVSAMKPLLGEFDAGMTALQQAGTAEGLTLFAPTSSTSTGVSSTTLTGQIGGMTVNQATELDGAINGLRLTVLEMTTDLTSQGKTMQDQLSEMRNQTLIQMQIAANTLRSADNSDTMVSSLKNIDGNTSSSSLTNVLRAAGTV